MQISFLCWAVFLLAKYASAEAEVVKYNAVEELTKLLGRLRKTHAEVKDIRVRKNEAKKTIMAQLEAEIEVELSKHPIIIDARNALNGSDAANTDACEEDMDNKIQTIVQELRKNVTKAVTSTLNNMYKDLNKEEAELQRLETMLSKVLKRPETKQANCLNDDDDNCRIIAELTDRTAYLTERAEKLKAQLDAMSDHVPIYIHTETIAARIRSYILRPVIDCLELEFKSILANST